MPWHVERRDGGHRVVRDADGHVAGCHATHDDAVRQLRALYANVPDATATVTAARERDVNLPGGPGHQLRDYWVTIITPHHMVMTVREMWSSQINIRLC